MTEKSGEYHIRGTVVLGIDPGLATVGFGVVTSGERDPVALDYGCIRTPGKGMTDSQRLLEIHSAVCDLITRYTPSVLAMEQLFFTRNITSAIRVAEARGVIMLAAGQYDIPVLEYTPGQVKQAVTGSGRSDKRQVQEMIACLLRLDEIPRPDDAADGLSIALCHLQTRRWEA